MDALTLATRNARSETGEQGISVQVKRGKYRAVVVQYPKGEKSVVSPIGPWETEDGVLNRLGWLACSGEVVDAIAEWNKAR